MMPVMKSISIVANWLVQALSAMSRLQRDQSGGVLVLAGFAIVPLIGFIGIGTDTARGYLVRSHLSSALDAAALVGGRNFYTATRDDDIRKYFNANFPPNYLGSTVSGPLISVDETAGTIELSASVTVPTTFMSVFGFNEMTVATSAEVTRIQKALDVVLAVDMSGSMGGLTTGGVTRLQAARTAATDLVDILFGSSGTKDLLNIGLVPWNGKVNVTLNGAAFDPAATTTNVVPGFINPETGVAQSEVYFANNSPVPMLSPPVANWKGCAFSRYQDDVDDTNDADVFLPAATFGGTDWHAWQPIGPEGEPVSGGTCSLSVNGNECGRCVSAGITPLNNAKQTTLDAIADLTTPTGTTNITQGLGWAWRVLKPEAPFTEAVANPTYLRQQAVVLLTDGENFAGNGDGYKTIFGYGNAGRPEMDARLLEIAANIKAEGVLVYVIQFANNGTSLQALLQQVASSPDTPYYHYAPDADTLKNIFREIANHLSKLRLSK